MDSMGILPCIAHGNDPRKVLLLTDGVCADDGTHNPKAVAPFVGGPAKEPRPRVFEFGRGKDSG